MAIISTIAMMTGVTQMEPFDIDEAMKSVADMIASIDQVLKRDPDDKLAESVLYSAQKLQMRLEDAKQKSNK